MEFKEKLKEYREQVESGIARLLPPATTRPALIHEAMLYSLSAGGKRIRPTLTLAACELAAPCEQALPGAVAIECIHTYSLIHDDLPAVDNGSLRRGLPTCHVKFDEATAVLAGDALLTYAFQLIARHYRSRPAIGMSVLEAVAETAGSQRLIGGQVEDILGESKKLKADDLEFIHLNKTSALIECSLEVGALIGGASAAEKGKLVEYGRCIGLGFQIVDDILDATSDAERLGKDSGTDVDKHKATYVSMHGIDRSRAFASELSDRARQICHELDATFLKEFAAFLNERVN